MCRLLSVAAPPSPLPVTPPLRVGLAPCSAEGELPVHLRAQVSDNQRLGERSREVSLLQVVLVVVCSVTAALLSPARLPHSATPPVVEALVEVAPVAFLATIAPPPLPGLRVPAPSPVGTARLWGNLLKSAVAVVGLSSSSSNSLIPMFLLWAPPRASGRLVTPCLVVQPARACLVIAPLLPVTPSSAGVEVVRLLRPGMWASLAPCSEAVEVVHKPQHSSKVRQAR